MRLLDIYNRLLEEFGHQGWWPAHRNFQPQEWEVAIGAILTQNTNWNNVEKALDNLESKKINNFEDILKLKGSELKTLIRPAGFFNQKAERLRKLSEFVSGFGSFKDFKKKIEREDLLQLNGIGPETADSILLYACDKPYFVVDAYTRRVFSRMGVLKGNEDYETIRRMFEKTMPKNVDLYKEFHALIVVLAKRICKKKPACQECPLEKNCKKADV